MEYKTILFSLLFTMTFGFFCQAIHSQTTTYSKNEESMLHYVNNQLAYSKKYNTTEMLPAALDSCRRFMKTYPRSFAKPGVFSYMLQMTLELTSDMKTISPLIDSVLFYDPSAKYSIAQWLVKKNIEPALTKKFLTEIYSTLTVPYHKYWVNQQFARYALNEGKTAIAKKYYELSMSADSTRAEGWYEYAAFLKNTEQLADLNRVMKIIRSMEEQSRLSYEYYSHNSPNINKPFFDFKMVDLDGKQVDLHQFAGKPIVAKIQGFWCPQNEQLKTIKKISEEFPDATYLFIEHFDTPEELKTRYLKKPEYKFLNKHTIVFDDSMFHRQLSGLSFGTIFIIDGKGNIRAEYDGYRPELENKMKEDLRKIDEVRK